MTIQWYLVPQHALGLRACPKRAGQPYSNSWHIQEYSQKLYDIVARTSWPDRTYGMLVRKVMMSRKHADDMVGFEILIGDEKWMFLDRLLIPKTIQEIAVDNCEHTEARKKFNAMMGRVLADRDNWMTTSSTATPVSVVCDECGFRFTF